LSSIIAPIITAVFAVIATTRYNFGMPEIAIIQPQNILEKREKERRTTPKRISKFILADDKKSLAPTRLKAKVILQTVNALIQTQFNKKRAAEVLGISERAVHKRINTFPAIKEEIDNWTQQTIELSKKHIEHKAYDAATTVTGLMSSDSERMQLDAATQVLDRAGIVKPSTTNVQVNVLNDLRKDKQGFDL